MSPMRQYQPNVSILHIQCHQFNLLPPWRKLMKFFTPNTGRKLAHLTFIWRIEWTNFLRVFVFISSNPVDFIPHTKAIEVQYKLVAGARGFGAFGRGKSSLKLWASLFSRAHVRHEHEADKNYLWKESRTLLSGTDYECPSCHSVQFSWSESHSSKWT